MSNLLSKAKAVSMFVWDFIIPRFISEEVALRYIGVGFKTDTHDWSAYEIVCSLGDVQPGESFDAIASVDAFQFLFFGVTYRIGNFRKWPGVPSCG
jgi:hypothetical protein